MTYYLSFHIFKVMHYILFTDVFYFLLLTCILNRPADNKKKTGQALVKLVFDQLKLIGGEENSISFDFLKYKGQSIVGKN